ncbi:MAG: toll/interleukin-1 receptor domain-containing protein [Thermodesulfobacteriota bacterium]
MSHNKADKNVARLIAAQLVLTGIEVWLDEWEIQAGDSIPGKLNEGLSAFDAFILLWSTRASRSNWVRQELHSAIMHAIEKGSAKIVPCLLDGTPLPPLISDRRAIDFSDFRNGVEELLGDLAGSRTRRQRLLAIQAALKEMDVQWITHPSLPPMVCCPKCGETDTLEPWEQTDHTRGDRYAGMRCANCGWSDGGEM